MALLIPASHSQAPRPRWRLLLLAVLASTSLLLPARAATAAGTTPEYQIKAVFLFNFAQFIEWPPAAFADPQAPLIIGVLGDDPFGASLDETVRDEVIGPRKLVVQRYRRVEDITHCHILFISPTEKRRLPQILESLRGAGVLTVSEMDQFTQFGGMINFFKQENTVRFEINVEASRTAKLKISAKLLQVAKISEGLPERGKN